MSTNTQIIFQTSTHLAVELTSTNGDVKIDPSCYVGTNLNGMGYPSNYFQIEKMNWEVADGGAVQLMWADGTPIALMVGTSSQVYPAALVDPNQGVDGGCIYVDSCGTFSVTVYLKKKYNDEIICGAIPVVPVAAPTLVGCALVSAGSSGSSGSAGPDFSKIKLPYFTDDGSGNCEQFFQIVSYENGVEVSRTPSSLPVGAVYGYCSPPPIDYEDQEICYEDGVGDRLNGIRREYEEGDPNDPADNTVLFLDYQSQPMAAPAVWSLGYCAAITKDKEALGIESLALDAVSASSLTVPAGANCAEIQVFGGDVIYATQTTPIEASNIGRLVNACGNISLDGVDLQGFEIMALAGQTANLYVEYFCDPTKADVPTP